LAQQLNYIHNNPVDDGIVRCPAHLPYSSAVNYAGLPENFREVDIDVSFTTSV
jgi:hypothetical protein